MKKFLVLTILFALALSIVPVAIAQDTVQLTIGSWRTEDIEQWDQILAAFNEVHPEIQVSFEPTLNTEYDASLLTSLQSGTGPDLITCRPFDRSLALFNQGFLSDVTDMPGLENFGDVARSGWISDEGQVYCVPMASVIHGYIYNADMFAENGWEVPTTTAEFMTLLQTIKDAGVTPLAIGTKDGWTTLTMGFNSNGPNFWHGEEGRQALINGTAQLTDEPFLEAFRFIQSWEPFLPDGHEAIGYADTQQLFPLGLAAIFPAGSWEIPLFESTADFNMAAFKPPVVNAGDQCYISDHVDIGMGMNTATANPEAAQTFLEWVAGPDFAQLYTELQPGFFSLSNHPINVEDPLAATFVGWRQECETTIRYDTQYLSRNPDVDVRSEEWRLFPLLVQGQLSAEEVAAEIQSYLSVPGAE